MPYVWTEEAPATSPTRRAGAAMQYDPVRNEVVMFGGYEPTFLDETWVWSPVSGNWTQRSPASAPSIRSGAAMAWDAITETLILFGGNYFDGATLFVYGDTWSWDGTDWTELFPGTSPSDRAGHGMAEAPSLGNLILFGGLSAANVANDETWRWSGTNWIQVFPATSPIALGNQGMTYDPMRGNIVLWGGVGTGPANTPTLETWTWNGTIWTQETISTDPHPEIIASCPLAYVATCEEVLAFGYVGTPPGGTSLTWVWNGVAWTDPIPSGAPVTRYDHVMSAYPDGALMFSGLEPGPGDNDTWTFNCVEDITVAINSRFGLA